ncbi:DUF541 domain-containing protein [bacterium]|nr:DUF541 domain-containing protein [bacterium]
MRGNSVGRWAMGALVAASMTVLATAVTAKPAAAQAIAAKPYDPAVVRVAGRSELFLPPDQARVSLQFYGPGKTAAEASKAVSDRARAFADVARAVGRAVTLDRTDVSVSPVMKEGGSRRPDSIRGYEANASVTMLVTDLALLSRVVEVAVNAQPDSFGDVDFSIADTAAARSKARKAAIGDAVDKARVYVEGAGYKLGRLLLVEEGGSNMIAQSGNRFEMIAVAASRLAAPDAIAPPPIAPEPQLYTAEVSVVYEVGAPIG